MTIDKLAWIYIKDRRVLFVRTKGNDALYTPGGKREGNETDAAALIREIKEELTVNLIPESITYLKTFVAPAHGQVPGTVLEIKCFQAEFTGTLTPSTEIEELQWLTSADAPRTTPAGEEILAWLQTHNYID